MSARKVDRHRQGAAVSRTWESNMYKLIDPLNPPDMASIFDDLIHDVDRKDFLKSRDMMTVCACLSDGDEPPTHGREDVPPLVEEEAPTHGTMTRTIAQNHHAHRHAGVHLTHCSDVLTDVPVTSLPLPVPLTLSRGSSIRLKLHSTHPPPSTASHNQCLIMDYGQSSTTGALTRPPLTLQPSDRDVTDCRALQPIDRDVTHRRLSPYVCTVCNHSHCLPERCCCGCSGTMRGPQAMSVCTDI